MKIWGDVPHVAGGPRAAIVAPGADPVFPASGRAVTYLAVRATNGLYALIMPDEMQGRVWGEGGTAGERQVLAEAGYDIDWRGPPAKPK